MERPTLRQLEILDVVVRAGGFRAAARLLGLSQVAVSDHIRQLEARLGTALFERRRGGKPLLSAAGQAALDHGRNVLFATDALIAAARAAAAPEVRVEPPRAVTPASPAPASALPEPIMATAPVTAAPGDKARPINMGAHPALVSRVQDQLAAAEEAFPERPIVIDYAVFTTETVRAALIEGRVDLALFFAIAPPEDFASDYLWSEPWSIYAADWHGLCDLDSVSRADLAGVPLILPDRTGPLRPLYETALTSAGLLPGSIALGTDDLSRVAAEAADGVAIFPAFGQMAAQFAARPGFRRLPLAVQPPPVAVRRAVAPAMAEDAVVLALAGLLV